MNLGTFACDGDGVAVSLPVPHCRCLMASHCWTVNEFRSDPKTVSCGQTKFRRRGGRLEEYELCRITLRLYYCTDEEEQATGIGKHYQKAWPLPHAAAVVVMICQMILTPPTLPLPLPLMKQLLVALLVLVLVMAIVRTSNPTRGPSCGPVNNRRQQRQVIMTTGDDPSTGSNRKGPTKPTRECRKHSSETRATKINRQVDKWKRAKQLVTHPYAFLVLIILGLTGQGSAPLAKIVV